MVNLMKMLTEKGVDELKASEQIATLLTDYKITHDAEIIKVDKGTGFKTTSENVLHCWK